MVGRCYFVIDLSMENLARVYGALHNETDISTAFNMVLNARVVKSLVEKRCIARGLGAWQLALCIEQVQKPQSVADHAFSSPWGPNAGLCWWLVIPNLALRG